MSAMYHFGLPQWESIEKESWMPTPKRTPHLWVMFLDLVVTRISEQMPRPKAYMKVITVAGLDGHPDIALKSKYNDQETRDYHNYLNHPRILDLVSRNEWEIFMDERKFQSKG